MHINDFKKQNGRNQSDMKTNDFKTQESMNQSNMNPSGFMSQSGMKIRNDFFKVYCTKCGVMSPARIPTKCPMGGFHIWANIP